MVLVTPRIHRKNLVAAVRRITQFAEASPTWALYEHSREAQFVTRRRSRISLSGSMQRNCFHSIRGTSGHWASLMTSDSDLLGFDGAALHKLTEGFGLPLLEAMATRTVPSRLMHIVPRIVN